jgi:glucan phosphoethanolaminetransferase (alkaline phosphatase superfamily)
MREIKANYVSHILKTDKDVRSSFSNILNDVKDEGKKDSNIKYILSIVFIIIFVILLLYFIIRKKQPIMPSILNYSMPNYLI